MLLSNRMSLSEHPFKLCSPPASRSRNSIHSKSTSSIFSNKSRPFSSRLRLIIPRAHKHYSDDYETFYDQFYTTLVNLQTYASTRLSCGAKMSIARIGETTTTIRSCARLPSLCTVCQRKGHTFVYTIVSLRPSPLRTYNFCTKT
jgi:hypothetical protein